MIAELEFDDELFQGSKNRTRKIEDCYKPKNCHREWFEKSCPENDPSETLNVKKYWGDLCYHRGRYKEALTLYQESQQFLPPNNAVLDRELKESIAMCLWKLGKCGDAVAIIKGMMEENQQNADSAMWHLLAQVYRDMGHVQGEIEALQRCATFHPWNYRFWFSLGLAYEKVSLSCLHQESIVTSKDGANKPQLHLHTVMLEQDSKEKTVNNGSTLAGSSACNHEDVNVESIVFNSDHTICKNETSDSLLVNKIEDKQVCCSSASIQTIDGTEDGLRTICHYRKCTDCTGVSCSSSSSSTYRKCDTLQPIHCCQSQDMDIVKWRRRHHIYSFCCLVKARYFLEKAIEASSSFVKTKHKAFLPEVSERINTHVECGCALLTDKVLQILYNSAITASGQLTEQDKFETNNEDYKHGSQAARLIDVSFEQKWFGDVLSYMS